MPEVTATPVAFEEANQFLRDKIRLPSRRSDELRGAIHAKAFTVAGATKAQLLDDLHRSVSEAIEQGQSISDFRKSFDATVSKNGWSYRGNRGWRTRVIYDTNMRTARMAGRWDQMQRTKERRPYLQYLTAGDRRVRPEHAAWDNLILNIDDDWWKTHYPPNGWGCRCTVRTLSQRQLERSGLIESTAPKAEVTERVNTRTGEVYGDVPVGIDTGWDYNVGRAWLAPEQSFGEVVAQLPPGLRNEALDALFDSSDRLVEPYVAWARSALNSDSAGSEIPVGFLSRQVVDFLDGKGVIPSSVLVTILDHRLRRMGREVARRRGKETLPEEVLFSLPERVANPAAILWDKEKRNLAYVTAVEGRERLGRLTVSIDFVRKGQPTNTVLSGALIPVQSLADRNRYELVEGEL